MKKEKLVKKWLNDELTSDELKAFKRTGAYPSYVKLLDNAKYFKAPDFNEKKSFKTIETAVASKKAKTFNNKFKFAAAVAAIFIVAFSALKIFTKDISYKTFETDIARTEHLILPDNSEVNISSKSSISYKVSDWDSERVLKLDGEAFFKVEKGKKFTVETSYGSVEVLGTQFNVKSRDYNFEVTCYEGAVRVSIDGSSHILKEKDVLSFTTEKITKSQTVFSIPDWKRNSTQLKSKPLEMVLKEFQNYYDVYFDTSKVNTSRLYTGSFNHNDIDIALKSITLPLDLTYQIEGKKVVLSNK